MTIELSCFKAYDIRGRVPNQLSADICRAIGAATVAVSKAKTVVVGQDARPDSPAFAKAFADGVRLMGADVVDLGLCGTEEVYFYTAHLNSGAGAMITASHNPIDYNGIKIVKAGSRPYSATTGLAEIQQLAEQYLNTSIPAAQVKGKHDKFVDKSAYVEKLLSSVDVNKLTPLKIVCNAGNGTAGQVMDLLEPHLPFELVKINNEPDASFPNGIPNPLLPERRAQTRDAVIEHKADLGIAWDGDFDRCFFFDGEGDFIEGYYIVGLLAEVMLAVKPEQMAPETSPETIVYDSRMTWNTIAKVKAAGGTPLETRTGHAFIKDVMRQHDAVYGGEMSAHHYFRDFFYCDSGMLPWLLVTQAMSSQSKSLSQLIGDMADQFPCSGEINFKVDDATEKMERLKDWGLAGGGQLTTIDGYSLVFADWRFNVRKSNTEPLLRLNVETRGDKVLLERQTAFLSGLIEG